MKMMKRSISAMISGALVLALTACGGSTSAGGAGTQAASSAATGQTQEGAVAAGAAAGNVADYSVQPELDSTVDYTQGDSYNFIIATDGAEDRVDGLLVHYLADELNSITGGRIQLSTYFNGSMGTDTELCESTQSGDVAFFLGSTEFTANFVPELSVIDLPFLYKDAQQFRKTMDDETVFNYYKEKYNANGFELLGFFDQGMRQMTSNIKVQSPEDMKGQKIRVMENKLHISIWQALGANPSPMAFSEVYMALQQGTIDAQENPFEVIYANRLYEQQKYVILTNHLPAAHNLVFSQTIYNSLSDSDKALIHAVAKAGIEYSREQCDQRLEERMKLVQDTGTEIVELPADVLQQLRDNCAPVYDEVRGTYGDELVDMQMDTAAKYN